MAKLLINQIGLVFNIQRFSIHDGPGIRTTVFLKGCPLHCFWCHNPEGMRPRQEIQFYPARCIMCGECVLACQQGAHILRDGVVTYDRELCTQCGRCVESCPAEAVELAGKEMTVDQVMQEVLADRPFYETSGGGMTISGGEPLLQMEFTCSLLEYCKAEGIHTAIETSGSVRWEKMEQLLPVTDLVLMDLKHMDPEKHRQFTGVSNRRILENARRLAQTDKAILFHTPVVPGVNDTPEEIAAIAQFTFDLVKLRATTQKQPADISLMLLPFHRLAADKYKSLGMDYRASNLDMPSKEKMQTLLDIAKQYRINVK